MAVDIPIWDDNPGTVVGATPFAFYDADASFQIDAPKFAKFASRRLGYPVTDIELQSGSFYTAFEEAITEYSHQVNQYNIINNLLSLQGQSTGSNLSGRVISQNLDRTITISKQYGTEAGSGGDTQYHTGSIAISESVQRYDLNSLYRDSKHPDESIEIKRIYHNAPAAIGRYFDPYVGTGLGYRSMMEGFGWGNMSPEVQFTMMPVYEDLLRLQAIEFNDQIRKSQYSFNLINNQLKIFPIPTRNTTLYFDYVIRSERGNPLKETDTNLISDYSNVPYNKLQYSFINDVGRQWIFKYALALSKEMLGWVRSKYSSIPIPDNEVSLNGDSLISSATEEKAQYIEELRSTLESLSNESQLEKKKNESEYLQDQLGRIPLPIYVGTLAIFISLSFMGII